MGWRAGQARHNKELQPPNDAARLEIFIALSVDCRQRNNRYASSGRRAAAPFVMPATRRGFGSRLLECSIAQGLEEEVSLCYEAQGGVCILDGELSAE